MANFLLHENQDLWKGSNVRGPKLAKTNYNHVDMTLRLMFIYVLPASRLYNLGHPPSIYLSLNVCSPFHTSEEEESRIENGSRDRNSGELKRVKIDYEKRKQLHVIS